MTPAARRGCAESVARSPVRAASCALPTYLVVRPRGLARGCGCGCQSTAGSAPCASISASTCIARSIHCTSDRITTHTQCILCTRHSSSSFADSPQPSEHEHESPQWAATAARQRTQVAAPGRLTQRARLTWETPRPHCPLLTVYTCTHLNTHREPRRGCSVAPHTGFSPAHTHAGGACYLVTLLATTR